MDATSVALIALILLQPMPKTKTYFHVLYSS